jgi:hypothetical protein
LVDFDVVAAFGGGAGVDVLGYGGGADAFAGEPADALEGEDGLGAVGEGFVLGWVLVSWRLRLLVCLSV